MPVISHLLPTTNANRGTLRRKKNYAHEGLHYTEFLLICQKFKNCRRRSVPEKVTFSRIIQVYGRNVYGHKALHYRTITGIKAYTTYINN